MITTYIVNVYYCIGITSQYVGQAAGAVQTRCDTQETGRGGLSHFGRSAAGAGEIQQAH